LQLTGINEQHQSTQLKQSELRKPEQAAKGKATDPTWSGLFTRNRAATNGMSLDYIPSELVEGSLMVKLDKEETNREADKWTTALVVYVIGETPGYNYMKRYVTQNWNMVAEPEDSKKEEHMNNNIQKKKQGPNKVVPTWVPKEDKKIELNLLMNRRKLMQQPLNEFNSQKRADIEELNPQAKEKQLLKGKATKEINGRLVNQLIQVAIPVRNEFDILQCEDAVMTQLLPSDIGGVFICHQ
ncbi:hypothetical protein A4A49_56033, partial [Nicotiana attenuata]